MLKFWVNLIDYKHIKDLYYGYVDRLKTGNVHIITLCCDESETIDTLIHELEHAVLWHVGEVIASQQYDNID